MAQPVKDPYRCTYYKQGGCTFPAIYYCGNRDKRVPAICKSDGYIESRDKQEAKDATRTTPGNA